ncbi:MAG: succinyl-diaminopimelate desuccinylase [Pseudomonadota bacterium]
MSEVLELTCDLIRRPSVTPQDAGCQALLAARLEACGFKSHSLPFGEVENLFAVHGDEGPVLWLLGHTDVVPSGPEDQWDSPPFEPTVSDGMLVGRGAADMKGAVAAMVLALERFVAEQPQHPGRIGILLTSDEEGVARDGVRKAGPALCELGFRPDYCLVGEPSSLENLADNVRIGRRGSMNARLTVTGVQGHAAFPHRADNAIHKALGFLHELASTRWDEGSEAFPPTSLQLTDLKAGVGASNVIPGELTAHFNFRFSPLSPAEQLKSRVAALLESHGLTDQVEWQLSGEPFLTDGGELVRAVDEAVTAALGAPPAHDTGGGTSDGRFVAPLGAQVVELGMLNATIHKINERVPVVHLDQLSDLYLDVLRRLPLG